MGAPSRLVDLESLAQDMARLEMDRDTADIVFVVILTSHSEDPSATLLTSPWPT